MSSPAALDLPEIEDLEQDLEEIEPEPEEEPREPEVRKRKRPDALKLSEDQRGQIVTRVREFADADESDRYEDIQRRMQREAKLKMWLEPRDEPWPDAMPVGLPDMMAVCLKYENTLQNSALTSRPMVNSQAQDPTNRAKERPLDLWHDHQMFVLQPGEKLIEGLSADFIREGQWRAYGRWVREHRRSVQVRTFSPIPFGVPPKQHFQQLLDDHFEGLAQRREIDKLGWDWKVFDRDGEEYQVRFYTSADDEVEMEIQTDLLVFDGPCWTRVPYECVLHPAACENLQAPGPSNPHGAAHVILVDYPTLDEVRRLVRAGVYDLIELEDVEQVQGSGPERSAELEDQKLHMRGYRGTDERWRMRGDARNHDQVTRLRCFDVWLDEEGESHDVVWTVLEDLQLLASAKPLGEVSPGNPPMRPIAEAVCIPIPGQCTGIGMPELMESCHDWETKITEQMVDAADIEITPFFTYRKTSSINPEEYRIFPGAGLPVTNPQDVSFARINPTSSAIAINQISLIQQKREGLTQVGALQLGKIPQGGSAALRTSSGINQVLAQGEASPERMLRRFFLGIRTMYQMMFQMNRFYLDKKRVFRTTGAVKPSEDPWITIEKADLSGRFDFDFTANVLNTSKAALQEGLQQVMTLMLSPLAVQDGMSTKEGRYRLSVDYVRALGQTPEKYLSEPTPSEGGPEIMATEALSKILRGEVPVGRPLEGAQAHMQALQELLKGTDVQGSTQEDLLSPKEAALLQVYMQQVSQRIQKEQALAQEQAQAQQLASSLQQSQKGNPTAPGRVPNDPTVVPTQVQGGDVLDESLPASGTPQ